MLSEDDGLVALTHALHQVEALLAYVLVLEDADSVRVAAEDAGGLVFLEYDLFSINIDLQ
jgi:hypothetical protein